MTGCGGAPAPAPPAGPGSGGPAAPGPIVVVGDLVFDVLAVLPVPLGALNRGSDTAARLSLTPGGSAANTAVWLARLGRPVRFVSRVGQDPAGQALTEHLRREGVEPWVSRDPDRPTGAILVLVEPDGERSMVISPGAHHALDAGDLPEALWRGASLVHLTGYSFFRDRPREAARAALERARALGIPVSVDVSSSALLEAFGPRRFLEAVRGARYLLANADEGRLLTGEPTPEAIARTLGARFPVVAIKLGAGGCLCRTGGEEVRVAGEPAGPPVDTTGAGDAWNAGFLAGMTAGLGLRQAAAVANRVAAWVVQRPGAAPTGWSEADRVRVWAGP